MNISVVAMIQPRRSSSSICRINPPEPRATARQSSSKPRLVSDMAADRFAQQRQADGDEPEGDDVGKELRSDHRRRARAAIS